VQFRSKFKYPAVKTFPHHSMTWDLNAPMLKG